MRCLISLTWLMLLAASLNAAEVADMVIRNAKVITVDARFSMAEAVAIKGEKIIFVGKNAEIGKHIGSATKIVDAKGKVVMPGLFDSHVHPLGAG